MRKRRTTILCVIALCVIVSLAFIPGQKGKRITVAEINAAIKAKGAGWVAGENKFTHWTIEELKAMMGFFPEEISDIESEYPIKVAGKPSKPPTEPPTGLPDSFDWRIGGWVTPVRDQGERGICGSCWAFATVAQLESVILIHNQTPGPYLDLSEQFLVSCVTSNYGCGGGGLYNAYNFVRDTGTPDDNCSPYTATDGSCVSLTPACADSVKQIDGWSRITGTINTLTNGIKEAVFKNGPVSCGMNVYEDFFSYVSGCYQHAKGRPLGAHAVCIVGWTPDGCWIVKNSFGDDWGEAGFFNIKFGSCSIGASAGTFIYNGSN